MADRIDRIVALERPTFRPSPEYDARRWEAAELIYSERRDTGDSLRAIGERIGKSHVHVARMCRVWERYRHLASNPSQRFGPLYMRVKHG